MNSGFIPVLTLLACCFPRAPLGAASDTALVEMDTTGYAAPDSLPSIDKMPEVIERVAPVYPPGLARLGIEGRVVIDCLLSDSGTVDSVAVVKGVHPLLDSSAVSALRGFRFSPALSGKDPVPVLLQYEVPFMLDDITSAMEKYVNLQGTLRESGTRSPIADAMVVVSFPDSIADTSLLVPFSHYLEKIGSFEGQHLEERSLVTFTDSLGRFRFFSLPACSIFITSPLPGYEKFHEKEVIRPGEELTVTFYARRISYNEYEIVVYGKAEEKEVSRRQLTLKEVRKIPGIGDDAVRVIQAMPGVARPTFGSGEVVVRGAPTWDSRFYLDGTAIPLLYHFGGLKSIYNPDALETVDFYPGGWGTRYGGAIAGVIELRGRPPKSDRWHGQIDLNLIDGSCFFEGPVNDKVSLLFSARRSFIGELAAWYIDRDPDRFPFSVAPYYYDILSRIDVAFSEKNRCFLTLLHSRDSLGVFIPAMQGGSSEVSEATNSLGVKLQFTTALAGWDFAFTPRMNNSFRYSLTFADDDESYFGYVKVNASMRIHHFRDEVAFTPSKWLQLAAGADVYLLQDDLALQIPGGNGIINRDTTDNWWFGVVGVYANLTIKPSERLRIIPGIRYDYYPELIHDGGIVPELWNYGFFDNHRGISGEPSARLSARYLLHDGHTLKAAIGTYNQTPQPIGQTIHKTWGDPSIPTSKAAQYVAGYEWCITDLINADFQVYLNRQWDLPRQATAEDELADPGVRGLADGRGKMKGLELMLRHDNNGRFFGWLAYTFARSERWNPHTGQYELYSDDETHNIQLLTSWHFDHEWELGTRIRYVTGKPTTPIVDVVEDADFNAFTPVYGKANSDRMDPFFQIDIRVEKKFVYEKWMLSTYFDVQNLSRLFYKSPQMVIYNYDYTEKKTVSMIIQPALGIKAEF